MIRKSDVALVAQQPFVPSSLQAMLPTELLDGQVALGRFDARLPYIPISKIPFSIEQVTFEVVGERKLDPSLAALSERLAASLPFNGTTQALTQIRTDSNSAVHLIFESCKYSDYMATSVAGSRNEPQPELGGKTVIEYLSAEGHSIEALLRIDEFSPLVKPLGVSALIISADGYLIISTSASWVHNSPGLLVPPASGSADIGPDYQTGETRNVIEFIQREYLEEVDKAGRVKFQLLGLDTESNRLGKPEAFFIGSTEKTLVELAAATSQDDELKIQENDSKIALAFKIFDGEHLLFNSDLLDLIAITRDPTKGKQVFERKFLATQRMLSLDAELPSVVPELRAPYVSYPLQAALFHLLKGVNAEVSKDPLVRGILSTAVKYQAEV